MSHQPVLVAIAILYREGQFLMQLRDNIPNIIYPGHWAFFGGHLEAGETPEEGVKRELFEEICYDAPAMSKFCVYNDSGIERHVFYGELTVDLDQLTLNEGLDMGFLTPDDIRRGDRYSDRAGEVRPLGAPHQRILLDFMDKGLLPQKSG